MTNNDIIRRLRYTFDFNDSTMIDIFAQAEHTVTRAEISDWLKKDDDPDFKELKDKELASFLNGMINDMRGKKEGPQPTPEERLTNNIILRKLRIALDLKDDGMLDVLDLADFSISKHELSAFFRKPGHAKYKVCQDQIMRNFLKGLQMRYRENMR